MDEYRSFPISRRHANARPEEYRLWKRIVLFLAIVGEMLGYIVLTKARYEGQGLHPIFFRLTTLSDIFSIAFFVIVVSLFLFAFIRPERMGRFRTASAMALVGILVWLDFGIRHTPADEFSSEAAIALLVAKVLLLAVVLTGSRLQLSPIKKVFRILRRAVLLSILFILVAFLNAFFYPTYSRPEEIASFNADGAVILGAAVWHGRGLGERPSPALRERIDAGYHLIETQAVPRLIVTGGSAPGELAESEIARRELVRMGVDPDKIVEEQTTHSTLEQVQYLREELFQRQGWSRFVIVSDQYHLARVCDICQFNGLTVIGTPSPIKQPFLDMAYYRFRESIAMIEYWMLGR